jgi:hypothetical protein
VANPFLYTNSPALLHYTFAYFLCRSTYEELIARVCAKAKREAEDGDPRIVGIEFQIKSNYTKEKHGSR